jgi:hypothetical protein
MHTNGLHTFFIIVYKSLQSVNYRKIVYTSEKKQTVHFCVILGDSGFSETAPFRKIPGDSDNSGNSGKFGEFREIQKNFYILTTIRFLLCPVYILVLLSFVMYNKNL